MIDAQSRLEQIRFGFGPKLGGGDKGVPLGAQMEQAPPSAPELEDISVASRAGSLFGPTPDRSGKETLRAERPRAHLEFYLRDAHRKIAYAVNSPYGFVERLVQFWSNHFTGSVAKRYVRGLVGPFECEAIRPHITGRFEDMVIASTRHSAMMIYLDQRRSIGPNSPAGRRRGVGLNENLAREILELHTLGAEGGYTQTDVTEFARLLTGYSFSSAGATGGPLRAQMTPLQR